MALLPVEEFGIAQAALEFLLGIAVVVIWSVTLSQCRRKKDPAREMVLHLKLAQFFFWIYLLFDVLAIAVPIGARRMGSSEGVLAGQISLAFSILFYYVTQAFIFLALIHLGLGIFLTRTGQPVKLHRVISLAALAWVGLIVVLSVAWWSSYIRWAAVLYQSRSTQTLLNLANIALVNRRLNAVIIIFLFVASIGLVGWSSLVLGKVSKTHMHLKQPAVTMLLCSLVWFVARLYDLIITAVFDDLAGNKIPPRRPTYLDLISFFFLAVPPFVVLVLLYVLGRKTAGGLWSTQQPWATTQPGMAIPPQGYGPQYGQYPPPPSGFVYAYQQPGQGWQQAQMMPQAGGQQMQPGWQQPHMHPHMQQQMPPHMMYPPPQQNGVHQPPMYMPQPTDAANTNTTPTVSSGSPPPQPAQLHSQHVPSETHHELADGAHHATQAIPVQEKPAGNS